MISRSEELPPDQRWQCPHCGCDDYSMKEDGCEDDYYYESYHCNSCDKDWKVWYRLSYAETCWDEQSPEDEEAQRQRDMERNASYNAETEKKLWNMLAAHADVLTNCQYKFLKELIEKKDNSICGTPGILNDWNFRTRLKEILPEGCLKPTPYEIANRISSINNDWNYRGF